MRESILGNTFEFTEEKGKSMFKELLNLNNLCVLCGEVFPRTKKDKEERIWI